MGDGVNAGIGALGSVGRETTGAFLELLNEIPVELRIRPVVVVPRPQHQAVRQLSPHGAHELVVAAGIRVEIECFFEKAIGLGLLDEGNGVPAPEAGDEDVRFVSQDGRDVGGVVRCVNFGPVFTDHFVFHAKTVEIVADFIPLAVAVSIVRTDEGDLFPRLGLGQFLEVKCPGRHGLEGVVGHAEVVRLKIVHGQPGGGMIGPDKNGLVLLRNFGDGQANPRAHNPEKKIDFVFGNVAFGDTHRIGRLDLAVGKGGVDLISSHPALAVDLVDGHFGGGNGILAIQPGATGHGVHGTDLDRLVFGVYAEGHHDKCQNGDHETHQQPFVSHCPLLFFCGWSGNSGSGSPLSGGQRHNLIISGFCNRCATGQNAA